jgi:hypothetical protein
MTNVTTDPDLMFFTNRQRSTSSVDNMIQHWNWRSLNDRGKDARLVMMYRVPNENAAIPTFIVGITGRTDTLVMM